MNGPSHTDTNAAQGAVTANPLSLARASHTLLALHGHRGRLNPHPVISQNLKHAEAFSLDLLYIVCLLFGLGYAHFLFEEAWFIRDWQPGCLPEWWVTRTCRRSIDTGRSPAFGCEKKCVPRDGSRGSRAARGPWRLRCCCP